jgi:hypothetical protein
VCTQVLAQSCEHRLVVACDDGESEVLTVKNIDPRATVFACQLLDSHVQADADPCVQASNYQEDTQVGQYLHRAQWVASPLRSESIPRR